MNTDTSSEAAVSTDDEQSIRAWLALLRAPGLGPRSIAVLLQELGEPQEILAQFGNTLGKSHGLKQPTLSYLRNPDWDAVDKDMNWLSLDNNGLLTFNDPAYPPQLKQIPDPPPLIFYHGDPQLLAYPQIAIVGSRNPSHYGRETAFEFARHLSDSGLIVTSGLALGIDAQAHAGALKGSGLSVAVVANGLDRVYPARHRDLAHAIAEEGVIVSEFTPGTAPLAKHFPSRNRIISGLSLGTLVVEAALKSGSLITARLAVEQGREVFAIPGSIHNPLSKGCHSLLRQGAKLVEKADHILEELGPRIGNWQKTTIEKQKVKTISLNTNQNNLLQHMDFEPASIDDLVERSQLTVDTVSAILMELELKGCVTCYSGLYSRAAE